MEATPFGTGVKPFHELRSSLWRMDPWLWLAALGLIGFSIYVLGGATAEDIGGQPHYFVVRQIIYGVVGLVLMTLVARIDYARLKEFRVGLYAVTIGMILFVLAVGGATRGSRRWLELPFFNFQPSELGKLLLILALAGFVLDRLRFLNDRRTTVRTVVMGLIPAALVMLQPDLGTSLVYLVITVAILFLAGTKWNHFAAMAGIAVVLVAISTVALPKVGITVLKDYQVERLTAFLHPGDQTDEDSYQQNQALIALGSGRHTGRGFERATQTRLDFLPEHHTDFIFAVVGEALGFSGAAIVLALYALLIWRALRILTITRSPYGVLVAGGIVAMLMFQVFINVGMNIGIMPITGIPLPLMSYGGSSVIVTLIAIGLLQSIYVREQRVIAPGAGV